MQLTKSKILAILASLAICLWLSAASGLYFFIQFSKGYDAIRFSDVAFPWNWSQIRPKWGDYFIEIGLQHLEAGEWNKAFYFTRVGVAKSPGNLDGRLAMADMLFQANEVVRAVQVLEGGLEYAARNESFWNKMIHFLQYYQADREIIRILEKGLNENLVAESRLAAAQSALAKAYYHQANYGKVEEVVKQAPSIANLVLRSRIYFDKGWEELALVELESLNKTFPKHPDVVLQLTRFYRQYGEEAKAVKLARQTYLSNPYSIGAAVNYFRVLGLEEKTEIERFLYRVPEIYQEQANLFELLNYLAETGQPELQSSVIEQAGGSLGETPMIWFLAIEARINAQQHEAASEMLAEPPESINLLIPLHRILFHSLALTNAYASGADDQGEVAMKELFVARHIRPSTLLGVSKKLLEFNRPDQAREIVQYLLQQNPGNQPALAHNIRIELILGNTQEVLLQSKPLADRKALPFELKREIVQRLASDREIFMADAAELVTQILNNLTPSKKLRLLRNL